MNEELNEVAKALVAANAELVEAQTQLRNAHNAQLAAINKVNALQKRFDALAGTFKSSAHVDTDWGRNRGPHGVSV